MTRCSGRSARSRRSSAEAIGREGEVEDRERGLALSGRPRSSEYLVRHRHHGREHRTEEARGCPRAGPDAVRRAAGSSAGPAPLPGRRDHVTAVSPRHGPARTSQFYEVQPFPRIRRSRPRCHARRRIGRAPLAVRRPEGSPSSCTYGTRRFATRRRRRAAISLAAFPAASSCRISRWRGVSDAAASPAVWRRARPRSRPARRRSPAVTIRPSRQRRVDGRDELPRRRGLQDEAGGAAASARRA